MSRVQQLIVEVLKSRATRRDSKSYLDMFGRKLEPSSAKTPSTATASAGTVHDTKASSPPSPLPTEASLPLGSTVHGSLLSDAPSTADRISSEVPSLDESHAALVKLQGPFTDRQLQSIAEGLAYLQTLGLICIVVLDHRQWPHSPRFLPNGQRVDEDMEELQSWSSRSQPLSERLGLAEAGLRVRMVKELWRVSNTLTAAGTDPRPQAHAVMRVVTQEDIQPPLTTGSERAPIVPDDTIASVYTSLEEGRIPIIMPLALSDTPTLQAVCVDADDVMVALARGMTHMPRAEEGMMELAPLRLLVITNEGGVPSHARGGDPHLMINLASEYDSIRASYIWDDTHPTALSNLAMVRDCLSYMPAISSGVLATHRSPQSLIANLITNKAAYSPSLPPRLLAARREMRHMPTVVRAGLPLRVLTDPREIDWDRVQGVLESSFRRTLDRDAYFARLHACLDFLIVTGDYDGLAIVTKEHAPADTPTTPPIAYLDKFAVLPKLRGSGAVDFLWGALRDEVHGLGLLDALNHNGGRGGVGQGRDLVWKSRAENVVNRWYFERSNGFIRLPGGPPDWFLFWCDAEDRLKRLAGEPVVSSDMRLDEVWQQAPSQSDTPLLPIITPEEQGRLTRWASCLKQIPSAWR
ncbi:Amino-acid acetyltransferase, mitochondrial [Malassezia pachydermatis]|uniref:Amino-acid acetyltransferase, mitochondrial n=1 Tax=Malassezia pachydermatis TaxID=77020 RepID=A0A0M8MLZ8_9BASI|nr:arg2-acetylglutamate synthase [Malassezia pachydermatis]KOS14258.1 arg2-acetylglutamate synthase [Malassezia pachydermatis]